MVCVLNRVETFVYTYFVLRLPALLHYTVVMDRIANKQSEVEGYPFWSPITLPILSLGESSRTYSHFHLPFATSHTS
jgi:hypothetical protein